MYNLYQKEIKIINKKISLDGYGKEITNKRLEEIILELQDKKGLPDQEVTEDEAEEEVKKILKEKIKTKKVLVDDITNLKEEKISSFELDRKLIESLNKVNIVKNNYDELDNDQDIIKILYSIEDIDESLRACKKYYNETITEYNKLIRKIPYNIVGTILKYKEKLFFDGKDMTDEDINDFKL